jgi:translation elongation factor EF-Ts
MEQACIRDDKKSVEQMVKEVAKELGDTIAVKGYTRIELTAEEPKAE